MRGNLTAFERRHGQAYTGLDLPFGCAVRFRMPPPMLKSKHKFDVPQKEGAFLGWELAPGGVWHGDYIVADLDDLVSGKKHVRVYVVKELVDPDEIIFPLQGVPDVRKSWPEEYVEPGTDEDKRDDPRLGSSRPYWIDSKSWFKLQCKDRLRIAEEERQRQEAELSESFAESSGSRTPAVITAADRPVGDEDESASAGPDGDPFRGLGEASAATVRPVIIEFCCAPDSEVGNVGATGLGGGGGARAFASRVVSTAVFPRAWLIQAASKGGAL